MTDSTAAAGGATLGAPPVLMAKITRPSSPDWQISRPRLADQLARVRAHQVTLVKASAGYGKTSVCADWAARLQAGGDSVAWLTLDADDNEATGFFFNVAQAISLACDGAASAATDLIQDLSLVTPKTIAFYILGSFARIPGSLFLVLDDFHTITNSEIHATLDYLLRYAPETVHLILVTRTEPPLPLAELRAKNRLFEVDAAALGFDLNEISEFLKAEALAPLPPGKIVDLRDRTEGWPAILRILALTARGEAFEALVDNLSGALRPVSQYLSALLKGLPQPAVQFLARVSILERFTVELAEAVTQVRDASAVLAAMDADNLLIIPVDPASRWRRFHPLLLDHLRQLLEDLGPGEEPILHRRAADWHAEHGLWTDAIRHAYAAGNAPQAAAWVKRCALQLVQSGNLLTLLNWQRLFPAAMDDQADAKLAIAWGYALAARLDEAIALTDDAAASLAEGADTEAQRLMAQCAAIRSVIHAILGNIDQAMDLARQATSASEDPWTINAAAGVLGTCYWRRGDVAAFHGVRWMAWAPEDARRNVFVSVYRLCLLGLMAFEQLNVEQAERNYRSARRQIAALAGPQSSPAAFSAALLARLRYDQGRLDEAASLLDGKLPLISASVMLDCASSAYLVAARIAAQDGDFERAHAVLDEGEAAGMRRQWGPLLASVLAERIRLLSQENRCEEMAACVARLRKMAEDMPQLAPSAASNVPLHYKLGFAFLTLHAGRPGQAVEILGPLYEDFRAGHNRAMALRIGGLLALALLSNRELAQADEIFRSVVGEAARAGLPQPIIDVGADAGLLLHRFTQNASKVGACRKDIEFAEQTLARWRTRHRAMVVPPRLGGAAGSLTSREQKILELMAVGQSNKEIGRDLGITAETVKTHVKHIFAKLEVDRRAQAVLRGRELGYVGRGAAPVR